MKNPNRTEFYENLTNHERAALTFNALICNDMEAANNLIKASPISSQTNLNEEYLNRLFAIAFISFCWAIEYRKGLRNLLRINTSSDKDNDGEYLNMGDRLTALFLVLDTLEESHGVDKQSVLKITNPVSHYSHLAKLEDLTDDAQAYYHSSLAYFVSILESEIFDLSPCQ